MQEADEQDTCRICSAPAEPDQPLFHPCKCSGTIRYIHQDCLTTWLAHSKKKNCDVCKHPYSFTKVYASDMPSSLPPVLLIRRLIQHGFMAILFVIRAVAVAAIWLGVLPWVTVWTWRMYFAMGESTAWWISNRPRPIPATESEVPLDNTNSPEPLPTNLLVKITTHPAWMALSADIFTGQIIASLIVLTFVAVFLLREWISQNARPGVFEEEEVPPENRPAQPAAAAAQPAAQPPMQAAANALRHAADAQAQEEDHDAENGNPNWWDMTEADRQAQRRLDKKRKGKGKAGGPLAKNAKLHKERALRESLRETIRRDKLRQERVQAGLSRPPMILPPIKGGLGNGNTASPSNGNIDPANPFPPVVLNPPANDIPFSLRNWNVPPSSYLSPTPVRPPLVAPSTPFTFSMDPSQLTSTPNLSTYRAPEEFHFLPRAGPSSSAEPAEPSEPPPAYTTESMQADDDPIPHLGSNHPSDEDEDDDEDEGEVDEPARYHDENGRWIHIDDYDEFMREHMPPRDIDLEAEERRYFRDAGQQDEELESASDSEDDSDAHEHSDHENGHEHGDIQEGDNGEALAEENEDEDEDGDGDGGDGDGLFDDDGHWEDVEDDVEEVQGLGQIQAAADAPVPAQAAAAAQDAAAAAVDGLDEVDGNVEDDMEGVLEAIGLRGPVFGVIQNAMLMIFVLDTAIGIGIWIPFTIGKTTALLCLDPHRLLQVLHLPIRAMRLVTDPIVDFFAYILVELTLPWILSICKGLLKLSVYIGYRFLRASLNGTIADHIATASTKMYTYSASLADSASKYVYHLTASNDTVVVATASKSTTLIDSIPDYLGFTEPYFEALGKEIRILVMKFQERWIQLALGSGPSSRFFAISLGWGVISFLVALYLNLLTVGNARTAGLAVRNAVRQQLLVLKVAAFIFIELVTFPLGCGIVLDLCTVWLFPEANMQSRIGFFIQAPLTAMFYHWVAGTMFMYSFAVLLSGCRSVMRPGAMWFIKDPQDQNSHPIRDILDRPTLTQLRKICVSGLMYSFVVACVVGSVAGLLLLGSKSIMPFRWKNRDPLSNVPVDLLFLHLVLPYTMHYFRPKRVVKHVATTVWKFLATRLRLTSYFFGGRHAQEEYTPKNWRDNFIRSDVHVVGENDIPDGSFRRVPATDNLALPRDMRATVPVTADGVPIDSDARFLMQLQNAETEKAKKSVKDDFIIVYMPPYFRYRVIAFITLLWLFGAFMLGLAVALPIQLGRSFFRLFTPRDVHDGYALLVGFYLVWMCYLIARAVDRLDKRRQRRAAASSSNGGNGGGGALFTLVLKRGMLWLAKTVYMAFWLGVVIPVLLAIVVDLYMVLPIRFTLDPEMTPRIRVVDEWALGLLYAKIALHAHRIQPPNRLTRGLTHIMQHGWTHPDPVTATKEVIAPLAGGLLAMILFPGILFRTVQHLFPDLPLDNRFIFMHVYPSVFILAGSVRSAITLYGMLSSWSQAIRDKEFLVEMRLKNHEPEPEPGMEDEPKSKPKPKATRLMVPSVGEGTAHVVVGRADGGVEGDAEAQELEPEGEQQQQQQEEVNGLVEEDGNMDMDVDVDDDQ
ncbi:hypothetical protein BDN70DRAFT_852941 [Pholiota conissans]|uniref:RING-type E3 ubiquitin transferase n=1 Tax=Pholiota conissans TaxID=109636 RepID=A0A9P6CW74_9AGAR|nr:hypothetical protein BDN70DRAFT_852941 [Pholiota conissans]